MLLFHIRNLTCGLLCFLYSQDVRDNSNGPAVHRLAVRLLGQNLRGCGVVSIQVFTEVRQGINGSLILGLQFEKNDSSPTYPGVPQAVDITPFSTVLDRPKSLTMILAFSSAL